MSTEAQTYKTLGNTAFQQKNYQESIEHFTKAIECDPNDHVFYSNRSGAYASLEQYDKALEDANKCVELNQNWAKGYVRKGLAEFYLKKYEEAIITYNQGLQLDPNNLQLKQGLERAEKEKSTPQQGEQGGASDKQTQQLLMKLLSNPKTASYLQDPQFIQNLTMIQKNPQMISKFSNDPKMQEAFKVMFGLPENFDYQGEAKKFDTKPQEYQQQEQQQQPKQQPSQQQKPTLNEADQLKAKGNEFYKQRKFEEALSYYDQAIQLKPQEVLFYNNKTACYIEMGQFDQAHEAIDQALEIIKDQNILDFNLKGKIFARKASIYTKQQDFTNGIEYYNKSLLENNDSKVRDEYNKILKLKKKQDIKDYINPEKAEEENEVAKGFFQQGQWPEAIKHYDEAIKRNPKEPKYYGNKAACLMKLMEFPGALKLVEQQIEMDPQNIKALLKKANCHQGLREYHKQMDCYNLILKIEPNNQESKDGLMRVQMKMMNQNETKEEQEDRAKHAMADPEIQNILRDPEIMTILKNLQENPRDAYTLKALQDPYIGGKVNKLIAAGILKMG